MNFPSFATPNRPLPPAPLGALCRRDVVSSAGSLHKNDPTLGLYGHDEIAGRGHQLEVYLPDAVPVVRVRRGASLPSLHTPISARTTVRLARTIKVGISRVFTARPPLPPTRWADASQWITRIGHLAHGARPLDRASNSGTHRRIVATSSVAQAGHVGGEVIRLRSPGRQGAPTHARFACDSTTLVASLKASELMSCPRPWAILVPESERQRSSSRR